MHVPDGFLDTPTSVATGVAAAAALALAIRSSRMQRPSRTSPGAPAASAAPSRTTTALVTSFIFAGQMINLPVSDGTSGHLMGGAIATVLLGPARALMAMGVVLAVQAVLFADGGLSALGTNILLMGIVPVLTTWLVLRAAERLLPIGRASRVAAGALAGLLSVPLSAGTFVGLYAIGGEAPVAFGALVSGMLGWHLLIGVVEAAITAAVLATVLASRPHASTRTLVVSSAVASVAVATVASQWASGHPDGLEFVATTTGFLDTARDSLAALSPFADYATAGITNSWASLAVAGVVGVAVSFAMAFLTAGRRPAVVAESDAVPA
ncbi:energy-coupling factor ABC transporter permease [Salinibacterium sp. dk2585]|uniref:energy-coupling factor ABC transporter permease n=1 Tax=unclassified Salinibacterium TaxID=2632331 RepID=UPI0011C24F0F|nr:MULTISPECIES: energy-coupling factor ABC transporter permease [unclassified Salinibacterium]QEE62057.1 energy-coupling factor ABC transporter permease [Salinibacterium sp. dk2585]TXK53409.1 energy-coupling factor ABC transporter permease [Salinibacterium sp. dk5596]